MAISDFIKNRQWIAQFVRFLLVGILNTVISLGVIFMAMSLGVSVILSNLLGYAIGLINSFLWNKFYVFRINGNRQFRWRELRWFVVSFVVSYTLQLCVMLVMTRLAGIDSYLSQLLAMGVYTVVNFILNRRKTFV